MSIIYAELYEIEEHYNATAQASIPAAWCCEVMSGCNWIDDSPDYSHRQISVFGRTRREAVDNAIDALKSVGCSGNLRIHG